MEVKLMNEMVHAELKFGELDLCTYLSDMCDYHEDICSTIDNFYYGEDENSISMHFTFSSAVRDTVELHRLVTHKYDIVMDEMSHPLIDAMKIDLVNAISLLDSIRWSGEVHENAKD